MKKLYFLFFLAVCFFLLKSPCQAADIKIGLMCPLTGKWASEGQDMKNIVALLVDQTNASGGINGDKVQLVIEDDAGDPRTAALAAQKLASAGVIAIIGTYGSAVTEASQNIIDEAEILQIGTGSTSVRLTEKGLPLFFRTCPRDDSQGQEAAKALQNGNYKRVALLHDNSSYAKGLAQETRQALEKMGIPVIFFDALTPGERDYTAILTSLKAANPDIIFYTGYYPETGMLLRQKKEMGWDAPLMGGDASNHPDLVKISGNDAAKGYFFISPPLPQDIDTELAANFLKAFQDKYQSQPVSIWALLAGDAYLAIENALKNGADSPQQIAENLRKLQNLQVLSGELGFNEKGDRVGDFYRTYIIDENGKFNLQSK